MPTSALSHSQEKQADYFFGLVEETIFSAHPISDSLSDLFEGQRQDYQRFRTALLPRQLETTNKLIKVIKRNTFDFRNFDNFKKRILIALKIKKERTNLVLSRC